MESSETLRRIFWRNRWLLIALIILPVAIVVPFLEHKPVMFAATAHVLGSGTAPTADTEVQAVQAAVTSVATDTATVRGAIGASHVNRRALTVAQHHVSVTPLGSSAVMLVTVTDPSRSVAIRLARALANSVAYQIDQLGSRNNPQLAALNNSYQQLSAERNALVARLQALGTGNYAAQSLSTQLNSIEQQLYTNQVGQQQILNSISTGGAVLSLPAVATATSRHVVQYAALAGLLGLVVGLLIATIREVVRPTVAEPAVGARELGVVVLGDSITTNGRVAGLDEDLAMHLHVAAERLAARTLVLTGPVPRAQLAALADRLSGELPAVPAGNGAAQARRSAAPDVSLAGKIHASRGPESGNGVTSSDGLASGSGSAEAGSAEAGKAIAMLPRRVVALPDLPRGAPLQDSALVAVLPRFAPHAALDRIRDLSDLTAWPILGVIRLRGPERAAPRHGTPGPESAAEERESREPAGKGDAR